MGWGGEAVRNLHNNKQRQLSQPLRDALAQTNRPSRRMGQRLLSRFAKVASADFEIPQRQTPRMPPSWDEAA